MTRRITNHRRRGSAGFTLVELVVVILLLGILAGLAAPRMLDFQRQSAAQAAVTSVQAIFSAVELYAAETGGLPANTSAGEFPPELAGRLDERVFTGATPIGGQFDWNGRGTTLPTIGVAINGGSSRDYFAEVDALADDGDLKTGWITRFGGYLNFELTAK